MNSNDEMFKIRKKKEILNTNESANGLDNTYMNLNYISEREETNHDPEKAIKLELYENENNETLFMDDLDNFELDSDEKKF